MLGEVSINGLSNQESKNYYNLKEGDSFPGLSKKITNKSITENLDEILENVTEENKLNWKNKRLMKAIYDLDDNSKVIIYFVNGRIHSIDPADTKVFDNSDFFKYLGGC